jgi:hypothetical protein
MPPSWYSPYMNSCASQPWLKNGWPARVYEKLSTVGMAPCARIARPVATCHQKSFGGMGVSSGRSAISMIAAAR